MRFSEIPKPLPQSQPTPYSPENTLSVWEIVSRSFFLSNVLYGGKFMVAFEIIRGYTPRFLACHKLQFLTKSKMRTILKLLEEIFNYCWRINQNLCYLVIYYPVIGNYPTSLRLQSLAHGNAVLFGSPISIWWKYLDLLTTKANPTVSPMRIFVFLQIIPYYKNLKKFNWSFLDPTPSLILTANISFQILVWDLKKLASLKSNHILFIFHMILIL